MVWAYQSQVVSRAVTATCGVLVVGTAAARKVLPAAGLSAAAVGASVSAKRVVVASGVSYAVAVGHAQARHVAVVTGRGVLAVAATATAHKVASAEGRAYAVAVPVCDLDQSEPDLFGTLSAADRPQAHVTSRDRALAALSSTSATVGTVTGGDG